MTKKQITKQRTDLSITLSFRVQKKERKKSEKHDNYDREGSIILIFDFLKMFPSFLLPSIQKNGSNIILSSWSSLHPSFASLLRQFLCFDFVLFHSFFFIFVFFFFFGLFDLFLSIYCVDFLSVYSCIEFFLFFLHLLPSSFFVTILPNISSSRL